MLKTTPKWVLCTWFIEVMSAQDFPYRAAANSGSFMPRPLCVQVCHAAHWKKIILSCLSLCGVRSTLRGLARLSPGAMLLALKLPNHLKDLSLRNHVGLDFEACDCLSDGSWSFDWIRPNSTLYIAPEEHLNSPFPLIIPQCGGNHMNNTLVSHKPF